MLNQLVIQNFTLIEHSEINWKNQLNILTGETGAGKSILLAALKLLLGERADIKSLRSSEKKIVIEANFSIIELHLQSFFENHDLDYDDELIIRREILTNGKSRAFINDVPTTLEVLQKLAHYLIDIHSQFETENLLNEKFQLELLDEFAGNQTLLITYKTLFTIYKNSTKELKKLKQSYSELLKESDYFSFLLQELNEFQLEEINLQELENQLKTYENAEEIVQEVGLTYQILNDDSYGVIQNLKTIHQKLNKLVEFSSELAELNQRINSSTIEIQDVASELHHLANMFELNPSLLSEIKLKYNSIQQLLQKHQVTSIEELIEIKEKLANQNKNFETIVEQIEIKELEINDLTIELEKLSTELRKNRIASKDNFTKQILKLLARLGMEKATLKIEITSLSDFNETGKDFVSYLFSANQGIAEKTIDKAISGGERSRVMLSLKYILAKTKLLPTMIFDEIDTGVSGKIANEMAKMMLEMSEKMQVIVITHLPQTASKGKAHFKVFKYEDANQTKSSIKLLTDEERKIEIAHLLSGENITPSALEQAQELLNY